MGEGMIPHQGAIFNVIFPLIPSNLTQKGGSKIILKVPKRILSRGISDKFLKMKCIY